MDLKVYSLAFTLFFCTLVVSAQERPEIQQESVWMENFNADGKLDEWQQPLQAYNHDTHIAYSIANDGMYLY